MDCLLWLQCGELLTQRLQHFSEADLGAGISANYLAAEEEVGAVEAEVAAAATTQELANAEIRPVNFMVHYFRQYKMEIRQRARTRLVERPLADSAKPARAFIHRRLFKFGYFYFLDENKIFVYSKNQAYPPVGLAWVAELADAIDLRSIAARHAGSTPAPGII